MKSDFVRTGKRTYLGNIKDGIISLTRFYINNFRDGYYQDCNDYFLENLNPKYDKIKNHSLFSVRIILLISIFLNTYLYSFLKRICLSLSNDNNDSGFGKIMFKGILFFVSYLFIVVLISTFNLNGFIDLHSKHE